MFVSLHANYVGVIDVCTVEAEQSSDGNDPRSPNPIYKEE